MVKIPSMDEWKKMGSDLIDQAKSVKFGEIVDKVKAGIESVGSKTTQEPVDVSDEYIKGLFEGIFSSINELAQAQAAQLAVIKRIEKQMAELAKGVASSQKPATVGENEATTQNESTKPENNTHEPEK